MNTLKIILISSVVSCYCSFCYIAAYSLNFNAVLEQSVRLGSMKGWNLRHWVALFLAPLVIPLFCLWGIVRAFKQIRTE